MALAAFCAVLGLSRRPRPERSPPDRGRPPLDRASRAVRFEHAAGRLSRLAWAHDHPGRLNWSNGAHPIDWSSCSAVERHPDRVSGVGSSRAPGFLWPPFSRTSRTLASISVTVTNE